MKSANAAACEVRQRPPALRWKVRPYYKSPRSKSPGGGHLTRLRALAIGLSIATLAGGSASAAPDISGTYWATAYSPTIEVVGSGGIRAASRFCSAIRADLAMRGFSISFLTLTRVA